MNALLERTPDRIARDAGHATAAFRTPRHVANGREDVVPDPGPETSPPARNITPDSAEARLLFACTRARPDACSASSIRAVLRIPIDWNAILILAERHRVRPVLHANLAAVGDDKIPASVLRQLTEFAAANARRSLYLTGQLLRLLDLFKADGIVAAPFKGPMLAAGVYGNIALREAGDIDILVRRRDIIRARELLIDRGFQPAYPTSTPAEADYLSKLSGRSEATYLLDHSEHHLIGEGGLVNVDLHWALTLQQFALPISDRQLWSWLKPQTFASQSVLGFGPDELLLVLCINGAKDCWRRLDRICDVAELLRTHSKIDCERVFGIANQIGAARMVCVGLKLAADLLGSPVPHEAMARVAADERVSEIVHRVQGELFAAQSDQVEESGLSKSLFQLAIRQRMRDRIRYVLQHLKPTVGDWAALTLPAPLGFLHYAIRPMRLLREFGFCIR